MNPHFWWININQLCKTTPTPILMGYIRTQLKLDNLQRKLNKEFDKIEASYK